MQAEHGALGVHTAKIGYPALTNAPRRGLPAGVSTVTRFIKIHLFGSWDAGLEYVKRTDSETGRGHKKHLLR